MIATHSSQRTPIRSALTASTAALLCLSVAACSSTSNKSAAAPGGAQTSGASRSSDTSAPATTSSAATPTVAPAAASGTGHVCSLITQPEIESALGQPFSAGRGTVLPNGGVCNFGSTDGHSHLLFTVSSWAAMSQAASASGVAPRPVSGVGDEAFTVQPGSGAAPVLFVRKASTGFYLAMSGPQTASLPDHGLAKVEALAVLILPRL